MIATVFTAVLESAVSAGVKVTCNCWLLPTGSTVPNGAVQTKEPPPLAVESSSTGPNAPSNTTLNGLFPVSTGFALAMLNVALPARAAMLASPD